MKMKCRYLVLVAVTGGIFSQSASAISEAYRAQLEHSGCTQVSEADGTCHPKHNSKQNAQPSSQASRRSGAADPSAGQDVAREIDANIAGKYQGQAVDYMNATGWQTMNEEQTRWKKAGFIADFELQPSGKLMGVVVR